MKKIFYILGVFSLFLLQSCYDEYQNDYKFSGTYFSYQHPLRTLIVQEDEPLTFEVGVVIAGIRPENIEGQFVTFSIDTTLLNDSKYNGTGIEVLPSDYYTMSNDKEFDISKGLGTRLSTKITLDKDKFLSDPKAVDSVYVLPFVINTYSTDSVLSGKDYSVVMVRYYNQYHGDYFVRGVDYTYDAIGNVVDTLKYGRDDEVVKSDDVYAFMTSSSNQIVANYVGQNITTSSVDYSMELTVREDGVCLVSGHDASTSPSVSGSGETIFRIRNLS